MYNTTYDASACRYDNAYEESQSHSRVFNAFHHELADYLINAYDLRGKNILEIGCGKGDFLNLICTRGDNAGIGYDPAYVAERSHVEHSANVTIFAEKFPPDAEKIYADFILCKMTLEHIPETADFLIRIRKSIDPDRGTRVFFQVPDAAPVFEKAQFWDIYYEHCCYFTANSLARIFRRCGFEILRLDTGYDRQYLLLEAEPCRPDSPIQENHSAKQEEQLARSFASSVQEHIATWRRDFDNWHRKNHSIVLWGGGSKAVSFLTTLNVRTNIASVVDINPHKQGTFLPGTGHAILAPAELQRSKPAIIVVMNPVYLAEIKSLLQELHIQAATIPVTRQKLARKETRP